MSTATLPTPLFDRIHDALTANPYVPNRQVQVEATDGRVVLKGSVRSFFQKQMAQEAIRRVDGVQAIDNLLEVNWAELPPLTATHTLLAATRSGAR